MNLVLFISDDEVTNLRTKVPEYVEILNIPRYFFDTNFCAKKIEAIRKKRVESYFYGNNVFGNGLSQFELRMSDVRDFDAIIIFINIRIYYVGGVVLYGIV